MSGGDKDSFENLIAIRKDDVVGNGNCLIFCFANAKKELLVLAK